MQPVLLEAAGDGERPALRWRGYREQMPWYGIGAAFVPQGDGAWDLHLALGKWIIGIERTREED